MTHPDNRPSHAQARDQMDADAAARERLPAAGTSPPAHGYHLRLDGWQGAGTRGARRTRARLGPSSASRDRRAPRDLPCQLYGPDLWFSDAPADLEFAKGLCANCPARLGCLAGAIDRQEPLGVWGGQIFHDGHIVPFKRPRGRPRKHNTAPAPYLDLPDTA